jgi:tripartite-type tricarboxylate transporter receptor subunit TctC
MAHIPYKGSAQAMTDMLAGRVQLMIDPIVLQQAEGGKVRLLANANTKRWSGQPDIPSMSEIYPNYRWASGLGIVGPAKMPKEAVDKLNDTIKKIFDTDEGRAYLVNVAGVPQPISPEQYGQEIRDWYKRVGDIAARVDIKSGAN